MIYKDFQDLKLSALGMGCMRLPVVDGQDSQIDQAQVEQMVDYAMAHGVNYYDTAWGYHGGNSELSLGKALAKHPRDKFYLADKFPGYDLSNMPKVEEIFEKQLQKCGVEYFDFYLFHNVCEMNIDAYLDDEAYGIFTYLMEQKKNGRIRHLGFSCHGVMPVLKRFLEAYGAHMEFCQLQLNYVDWTFQGCKEKVELLKEYNIPVWVMEPLRGGRLCALPQAAREALAALRPTETPTAWAFRFIQSIPQITVTLSGMSNFQQMKENIDTFGTDAPLSEAEMGKLLSVAGGDAGQHHPLHRLPLLRVPLPPGAGHPPPAQPLQRALLHRRRVFGPHGPLGPAGGQAALGLYRLPELRGGLPPADQGLGGFCRLCGKAEAINTLYKTAAGAKCSGGHLFPPCGLSLLGFGGFFHMEPGDEAYSTSESRGGDLFEKV